MNNKTRAGQPPAQVEVEVAGDQVGRDDRFDPPPSCAAIGP